MAFVNASLLFAGLLTVIPVILHLALRQQPKRVTFPALRFVKERRESNRRQLQLRHWILLFLRAAAVAVLAAALARPSVASAAMGNWLLISLLGVMALAVAALAIFSAAQRKSRWLVGVFAALAAFLALASSGLMANTLRGTPSAVLGDQQAPVAAVLVFDTSPRMEYRFRNQTRLELAKDTGMWLLRQFPPESSLAVMESRPGPPFFAVDLAAAQSTVERLRTTGVPEALATVVSRAVDLVRTAPKEKSRREIYVFTDLAESAWDRERIGPLLSALESNPEILLYVIDVGVERPRNISLGDLQLSSQTLVKSGELIVSTDIRTQNAAGQYTVELLVEQPDPSRPVVVDGKPLLPVAQVRDRKSVTLEANDSQHVTFRVRGWEFGTQQGLVRVTAEDGLPGDNTRFFAVDVRESWPILLVAPPDVQSFLLAEALAPYEQRETATARFSCRELPQADLPNQDISSYAVICLVNPQPLPSAHWEQLGRYVERGGSLVVFLGHNAHPTTSFNEPAAQRILGGKLDRRWRAAGRELFLAPQRFDHPALAIFREQAASVPWSDSPVFLHWSLDDLAAGTSVVAEYSNGEPAIVERPLGQGQVVVVTTSFAEESRPRGRAPWNELLTSENAWPNFVLLNELMRYLASGGESDLNYTTGETATLTNDSERDPARYQLFTPLDEPQDIVPGEGMLSVAFTEQPGAYRLKGQLQGPVVRGFAVNLPAAASDLQRVSPDQLRELLGEDRFRYARNRDEIVLEVGEARVGREFYPYLLLMLVIILGLEHILSNRFYRKPELVMSSASAAANIRGPGSLVGVGAGSVTREMS